MKTSTRRNFLTYSTLLTATGLVSAPFFGKSKELRQTNPDDLYLVGPKDGFSPHIGSLLSMMTMMRAWVVRQVRDLNIEQLDFQIDDESNSIGAMLLHLAATEKYYQLNTFDDIPWGEWDQSIKDEWDTPSGLGARARQKIKGNDISYYLDKLESVRTETIAKFKTLDDDWLMKSEPFFPLRRGKRGDTNNYAKWFHVCEHESNHNGQIKFIKKRFA